VAVSKDGRESVPCRHPSRRPQKRAPQDEVHRSEFRLCHTVCFMESIYEANECSAANGVKTHLRAITATPRAERIVLACWQEGCGRVALSPSTMFQTC
jgi:hypothetical protein